MRRVLLILTVLGLMVFAGAALAESNSKNYLDKFSSVSYSGSDGSLHWPTTWKETLEADGPSSGKVRVGEHDHCKGSKCLIIGGEGLLTVGDGASRLADLSVFEKARLSYAVGFEPAEDELLDLATANLVVEVTIDGGVAWVPVDTVGLSTEQDPMFRSVDVSTFITSKFGIRFSVTGALGTRVLVDQVEIEGSAPAPTTTTTTSTTTTSTSTTTTTTTLVTLPPPTLPKLSTTSTTTTSTPTSVTTTTSISSTTSTTADLEAGGTTTTIDSDETTTTVAAGAGSDDDDSGGDGAGLQSGLRQTSIGVESDVPRGIFGSMPEVLSFEVAAGYANAVELIEASWVWVLGLALMIAAVLIKGIDRRLDPERAPDSTV